MGYYGKINEKIKAQKLRSRGFSYNEIIKEVSVSKDTLSRWCRDIKLSNEQKERLINKKINGQKKGSLIAAENKRNKRLELINSINLKTKKQLGKLSYRDRFIAGISLYTAEGDKMDGKGGFTNSDPRIIKFMMNWFIEYCKVPTEKFRGAIWIHEGLNKDKAKIYWSNLTGIPMSQFHKTYIAKNKINSNKIRKNIHEHGVFAIRFSISNTQRQIMGWNYALFDVRITSVL